MAPTLAVVRIRKGFQTEWANKREKEAIRLFGGNERIKNLTDLLDRQFYAYVQTEDAKPIHMTVIGKILGFQISEDEINPDEWNCILRTTIGEFVLYENTLCYFNDGGSDLVLINFELH